MIMRSKKPVIEQMTVEQRNEVLRKWLRNHDLFNVAALCRRLNYDRGAFSRYLEGFQDLGEDAIKRLEEVMVNYGYDFKTT